MKCNLGLCLKKVTIDAVFILYCILYVILYMLYCAKGKKFCVYCE